MALLIPSRLGSWVLRTVGLATLLGAPGCGTEGADEAIVDAWPRTPLSGFVLRDTEQPYALLRLGWDLDQPAVQPRADDPALPLTIWGRMNPRQEALHGTLFRAAVTDLGAQMAPDPALTPSAAWEGQNLSSPAWLQGPAGMPSLLFYQGGDGSIGLGRLGDDGSVQRLTTTQPLIAASALTTGQLGRVSALVTGSRVRLYYLVDGQHAHFAEADAAALWRFAAGGQATVDFQVSPPLLWAADFLVRQSTVTTVPAERIDGLFVRRVTTALNRDRFDLYAVATAMSKAVVVSASSYSGGSLDANSDHFLPVDAPALNGSDQGTPSNPTVLSYNGQALLVLGLRTVQTGIATAMQPN